MRTLAAILIATAGCTSILGVEDIAPITDDSHAMLSADQAPHAFGDVVTGQTSAVFTVSVTNSGTAPTGALATVLTGDGFVIASDTCLGAVLAPADVCTVGVELQPTTAGPAQGSLAVSASPGGAIHVDLSGTAYAPGDLKFDMTSYDFMIADVGTPSAAATFTLTNTGGSASGAIATSIGGDTAQFTIVTDGCNGATLDAGASCLVKVRFAPLTYGPFTLSILANATPGGAATVSLGGTGRTTYPLTITEAGDGTGTISATGLTCSGTTCTGTYARTGIAPQVVVTATPDTGVTLSWSGDCAGAGDACTVVMDQARSATATFSLNKNPLTVTNRFVGGASGKVTSSPTGINCGTACTATYAATTSVTLTATPNGSAVFQGWSGDCSGSQATCVVSMSAARAVTATFKPPVNYIFATSQMYPVATFGGLAGGDDICNTTAQAAGLPGHFVAFLSTSTVDAKTRVGAARGWIRVDGKPVMDQLSTTLATGQIFYSPSLDELGNPVVYSVMTGTKPDGTAEVGSTCSDYTSSSGYLAIGAAAYGALNWLELGVNDCSGSHPLWCLQTDYQTPVTVPPLSSPIAFVSKGYFDTATGLASADSLCVSEATAAGLPSASQFKALLGTHAMAPSSRFAASYNWMRPDDVPLNLSGDNLFDKTKPWLAPLDVNADKTYFMGADIAVGSLDPNTVGADTCNDWTVDTSAAKMDKIQSYTPSPFQSAYAADCQKYAHVICMFSNQ